METSSRTRYCFKCSCWVVWKLHMWVCNFGFFLGLHFKLNQWEELLLGVCCGWLLARGVPFPARQPWFWCSRIHTLSAQPFRTLGVCPDLTLATLSSFFLKCFSKSTWLSFLSLYLARWKLLFILHPSKFSSDFVTSRKPSLVPILFVLYLHFYARSQQVSGRLLMCTSVFSLWISSFSAGGALHKGDA